MFDKNNQLIARLVQENDHLASKLQLSIAQQVNYKAAVKNLDLDLEGAEKLAALRSPHTAAASSYPSFFPVSRVTAFTFPGISANQSQSATAAAVLTF